MDENWARHLTQSGFLYVLERRRYLDLIRMSLSGPTMWEGIANMVRLYNDEKRDQKEIEKQHKYLINRQMVEDLISPLFLSHMVDNFLTYLAQLLFEILVAHPQLLKSKLSCESNPLSNEEILEIVERKIWQVSKEKDKLAKLFKKLGIPLFQDREEKQQLEQLILKRNLIVHNRGIVTQHFANKVKDKRLTVGDYLTVDDDEVDLADRLLLATVRSLDTRAAAKYGLQCGDPDLSHIPRCLGPYARLLLLQDKT